MPISLVDEESIIDSEFTYMEIYINECMIQPATKNRWIEYQMRRAVASLKSVTIERLMDHASYQYQFLNNRYRVGLCFILEHNKQYLTWSTDSSFQVNPVFFRHDLSINELERQGFITEFLP